MKQSFSAILVAFSLVLASCTKETNNIVTPSPVPAPSFTFTATPTSLPVGGGAVKLKWTTTNTLGVSLNCGIGVVDLNDSLTVIVTTNTTYILTILGGQGTIQDSLTVVVAKLPAATFTITPTYLPAVGGQVKLKWTTQNATSASINQGIGQVNLNDSLMVGVTATTNFTLTIIGGGVTKQYTVTVVVPPTPPSGVNSCLSFNGTNSYVEIPNSSTLNITGNLTIEAFVKVGQFSAVFPYQGIIVSKIPGTGWGSGWELWVGGNGQHVAEFEASPGGTNLTASVSMDNSSWYHVAAVYDGTKMRVFVNGIAGIDTPATGSFSPNTLPVRFGRRAGGVWDDWFNGQIGSVRISNTARYTSNFTPPNSLSSDGNTMGLWLFTEGAGSTLHDFSGNGNDGIIYNCVWTTP